ncbi:tetratricopeptide repeat protein [Iodobacter ciconiae]|uniref:Tetratricopeptide repeat protein n=1 Tax=Iodobacter ciconiae TaxID=2496266 RepID=A0A3S8ZTV2_9NEIS|nr:tetratricopeptide repeat protein [Iodobacter ciconiae]AZN36930.1 tetratricopeptide repeat protein [Iodobacter ciconiae]
MQVRPRALPGDLDRLIASADEILATQASESLQLARHALLQSQASGYRNGETRAGLVLGKAQLRLGKPQDALATFRQALGLTQDYSLEKALLFEQIGRSYFDLGETTQAACIWEECAELASKNNSFTLFIQAQIGLGQVHFGFEEYTEALQCHYKAFDFLYTSNDPVLRCQVYINIAIDLYSLERLNEAKTMLQRARDISLTIRHLEHEAEIYRISGLLYLKQGDLKNARAQLNSALKICLLQDSPWHKASSLLGLGQCDMAEQLWESARVQLNTALTLATGLQNPHLFCHIHHALHLSYINSEKDVATAHHLAYTLHKNTLQRPQPSRTDKAAL